MYERVCDLRPECEQHAITAKDYATISEEYDRLVAKWNDTRAQRDALRKFVAQLLHYVDPTEHQDTCNHECPAYDKCVGSIFCEFPSWARDQARELGVEVDG